MATETGEDVFISGKLEVVPGAKNVLGYYMRGVPFADPAHFPNVDVYAERRRSRRLEHARGGTQSC